MNHLRSTSSPVIARSLRLQKGLCRRTTLQLHRPPGLRDSSSGFSLSLALLVGASALFGTLAIANRAIGSKQIRSTESSGLNARDAAEIGMNRIIAELNRPCNRRLLVNTPILAAATSPGQIAASNFLKNPCEEAGGAPADLTTHNTFNASGTLLNNEVQVPGTGGRMRYNSRPFPPTTAATANLMLLAMPIQISTSAWALRVILLRTMEPVAPARSPWM